MSHSPGVTEGCKRLIKNALVCWNAFDLTQRIPEVSDADTRTGLLEWVAAGLAVSWHQINPLGESHSSEREAPGLGRDPAPPNHRLSALRESGRGRFAECPGVTRTW
jgi:hypothetical protein